MPRLALLLLLLCACTPRPAEVCAPGGVNTLRFADRSDEVGLANVVGGRIMSADLNGDGRPDLIVHPTSVQVRDDLPNGLQTRFVLWNEGEGKPNFVDRTAESNYLVTRDSIGGRAANFAIAADVDNDGDLDLFSGVQKDADNDGSPPDTGDRAEVLINDGSGHYSLGPAPLHDEPWATTSGAFTDINRDGSIDLFLGTWYRAYGASLEAEPEHLLLGDGTTAFTDQSFGFGIHTTTLGSMDDINASLLTKPAYGVTSCDVNDDGWPDLLVSSYGRQFNELYVGSRTGFTERGQDWGFASDDNLDFSDNEFYRCYCQTTGQCNAEAPRISCDGLYWNAGVDDQPFRLGGNTFTTLCEDLDNDGDMDLLNAEIRHWHIGQSSDPSQILRNEGGRFLRPGNSATGLERVWESPNWNEGDIHAAVADLDNDGLKDILLASSDYPDTRLFFFHQNMDGSFTEQALDVKLDMPRSGALALGDYDQDGDLDIVVGFSRARCDADCPWDSPVVRYFENQNGQRNNALRLRLVGGPDSNRAAIGARIRVTTADGVQTYRVDGGHGHTGHQHGLELTIGVAHQCTVESVEVRWPDKAGSTDTWEGLRANYPIILEQGEKNPVYGESWR